MLFRSSSRGGCRSRSSPARRDGAGPTAGWLTDISDRWRINVYARSLRYGLGDVHNARELTLEQRYSLTRQSAVRLELFRKQEFEDYWNGGEISLNIYF